MAYQLLLFGKWHTLLLDLQQAGFLVDFVIIEVDCLCHFMQATVTKLSNNLLYGSKSDGEH